MNSVVSGTYPATHSDNFHLTTLTSLLGLPVSTKNTTFVASKIEYKKP
jgi:hypothetical protein